MLLKAGLVIILLSVGVSARHVITSKASPVSKECCRKVQKSAHTKRRALRNRCTSPHCASQQTAGAGKVMTNTVHTATAGYFREYALDGISSGPAIVVADEDDNIWTALAKSGKLARFSNGAIDTFDIGAESRPVGLAVGTKANGHAGVIWIAASYDNKLIRFDIVSKLKREFKIEGDNSWPFNVALGTKGEVWFTQRASSRIGRLDPSTGVVTHYDTLTPNAGPAGLAVDSKSGRVWFTESYADRVAVLEPVSGTIREYKMGDASTGLISGPAGLAIDGEGGVWFAKLEGKLGYIAPGSDSVEVIDVPAEAKRPAGIAVAANGDVWAVALDGNLLLRYRPMTRDFLIYPLPTGEPDSQPGVPPFARTARPFGIAVDRQGNVWFSEQYTGQLAVLDSAAPTLDVLSPSSVVRTADVVLTIRALDRVAGIKEIKVSLDGRRITPVRGRLDLHDILPGKHKLEVTVADAAQFITTATSHFEYAPGQHALQRMFERLNPRDKEGHTSKEKLLAVTKNLTGGDIRTRLEGLRQTLARDAHLFKPFASRALNAAIEFQLRNAAKTVEVRILDAAPYFSPAEVVIRKGDTVVWKYEPLSDGHSISHNLHRIEIQGTEVRSKMLRAGESFLYRFEQTGSFRITNPENGKSEASVKVVLQ